MGCGNCGSSKDGKPGGCKSNGNCSSGGCNRLNVHDWLSDIPVADLGKPFPFVEMSFNNGSRKDFYKLTSPMDLVKGQYLAVEGQGGFDVGVVSCSGEIVRLQMKKRRVQEDNKDIRRILRVASDEDIALMNESKLREKETMITGRVIINRLKLNMKLSEVEIQADGKKATYYYTAEDRVDFRELIRSFSSEFKMKVEMKQIGIRQEAGKIGGIGSCGRELCCSTWLTKFNSVSTSAARYQNLAINQTKLSGQCGRLKCCLNFELDTYMDALKIFPRKADKLKTSAGTAYLQKKDIFKNLLWYSYRGSSKLYPLSIERVNEIVALNKEGKEVDEMKPVEIESTKSEEKELEFADTVGHISLKSLDRKSRNKRKGKGGGNRNRNNRGRNNQGKKTTNNRSGNQGGNKQQQATNKNKPSSSKNSGNQGNKRRRPPNSNNKKGGKNTAPPKK
jgi:cell fate regulator YaaT (PSP1 superfamily)